MIGMGRTARRAYRLDEVEIVPSRRTRSSKDVSTAWQIDAYRFDIPLITHPTDAIVSPATAPVPLSEMTSPRLIVGASRVKVFPVGTLMCTALVLMEI